jgi:hypothetical protein
MTPAEVFTIAERITKLPETIPFAAVACAPQVRDPPAILRAFSHSLESNVRV